MKVLGKYDTELDFTKLENIDINTSNDIDTTFDAITKRKYDIDDITELVKDMCHCIGVANFKYYLKKSPHYIECYTCEEFMRKLKLIHPYEIEPEVTLCDVYKFCELLFDYDDAKYMLENKPKIINLWRGWKYEPLDTNDFTILEPLLQHVRHIICNDDEHYYNIFMQFFANILQNPGVQTGIIPVIYGENECSISMIINIFAELIHEYKITSPDLKCCEKYINTSLLIHLYELNNVDKILDKNIITNIENNVNFIASSSCAYTLTLNINNNYIINFETNNEHDKRRIYDPTNENNYIEDNYYEKLFKPILIETWEDPEYYSGECFITYIETFMCTLLKYMLTQVNVNEQSFKHSLKIIKHKVNAQRKAQTSALEQARQREHEARQRRSDANFERAYNSLHRALRFIVDNYEMFIHGLAADDFVDTLNMSKIQIQNKWREVCGKPETIDRISYNKWLYDHQDIYKFARTSSKQKTMSAYVLRINAANETLVHKLIKYKYDL